MEKSVLNNQTEVCITAGNLEAANLSEWDKLELHLLDQAAVVIPGKMTVLELFRTAGALQEFAASLVSTLSGVCMVCNNCKGKQPCDLMNGDLGSACISEDEGEHDLRDIPPQWLEMLRECGICLRDLGEKVFMEEAVYGGTDGVE